jgi:hypothetical protein
MIMASLSYLFFKLTAEPGKAQKELGIEKEASYVISLLLTPKYQ